MNLSRLIRIAALLLLPLAHHAMAADDDAAPRVNWSAKDTAGREVKVPAPDRPTVLLFVMADQERSVSAMNQVTALMGQDDHAQVIAVISGEAAPVKAQALLESVKWRFPLVADPGYAASGAMRVHAWPTTVVIAADGRELAHLASLPATYSRDLQAYLKFAHGKLDRAGLDAELESGKVVRGDANSAGSRYLHIAQRLLEQGQTEMARQQLLKGLELSPDDAHLKLTLAGVLLSRGQPAEALKLLDTLGPDQATPATLLTLRGRALVGLERFDEAQALLTEAVKLNPDPCQAYYFLARVHERAGRWQEASAAYRAAFEHSVAGRSLGPKEKSAP